MSHRTHQLDVDLLGGLMQLLATQTRVAVWLPVTSTTVSDVDAKTQLSALLRKESDAFHLLEEEVAARRQKFFEARAREDGENPGQAWFLDVAAAAGRDAAAHAEARRCLEAHIEEVVPRCVILAPGSCSDGPQTTVQLHEDGYALEESPGAALIARRAYLGLPDDEDWVQPTPPDPSRDG